MDRFRNLDWERYVPIILVVATGLLFIPIIYVVVQTYVPPPKEGEVTTRTFTPAHREEDAPICTSTGGKNPVEICIPQSHWEPDAWTLTIYGCAVARDGKTRCRTNDIRVSESLFELCEPGSYYKEGGCPPR